MLHKYERVKETAWPIKMASGGGGRQHLTATKAIVIKRHVAVARRLCNVNDNVCKATHMWGTRCQGSCNAGEEIEDCTRPVNVQAAIYIHTHTYTHICSPV